jgi:hypothetical protein
MPALKTYRCSSLPRIMRCPASAVPPAVLIERSGDDARLGTAVHSVLSQCVNEHQSPGFAQLMEAAKANGVETEDVGHLAWNGWKCWLQVYHEYPNRVTEEDISMEADGICLTGHPDVYSVSDFDDTIRILDWKGGFLEADARDQLRGYGAILMKRHPHIQRVRAERIGLRGMTRDWWTWERDEIASWWQRLVDLVHGPERFSPSPESCRYCPRGASCPAKTALLQQAYQMVRTYQHSVTPPEDPATLLDLYNHTKIVEGAVKQILSLIKITVSQAGGTIDVDGVQLVTTPQGRRNVTINGAFWDAVDFLDGRDLDPCLSVGLGELIKAVRAKVPAGSPRGAKKEAEEAFVQQLDDAGCLNTTYFEKLELRRSAQPVAADAQPQIEVQL